jgi:D-sedoheptulose 7-phosphate isomerase
MINKLEVLFKNSSSKVEYIAGYLSRLAEITPKIDLTLVARMIEVIEHAGMEDKSIFIIANGGSSAAASHFINDLGPNSLVSGHSGYRIFSLTDNIASVTAIANDAGFENIFAYQLEANMRSGDIVIAMSVSGNSENIVRGIKYANQEGGYTIGWTGFDGGRLTKLCELCLCVPTTLDEYGPVEDIFSILVHIITGYLTMKRGRFLSH